MGRLIAEGARHAGLEALREHDDEVGCLASLVARARDGDVVALMTHQDRAAVDGWLVAREATRDDPATLRTKVQAAGTTTPPVPA